VPVGGAAAHVAADLVTLFCPVALRDRGSWVRTLTRWGEIRWDNVERMQYLRWNVLHVVYLRRQPPGRFQPGAFSSRMGL
jgi:hypothetical protein